ncbi:MAG: sugar phosphate isomerase/epimerase [Archaeoglobaceae archaeon]|nr:sugar phosphate isomerase/epimerase [Archaeoglobaceae archaeon]MDW8117949.1 sugar phosphate isomerase/epimerase [Archaeoglobaceae archaeon]
MKILFSSMFLYEYSTDMIAKAVEASEYDGVEFWVETPYFWIDRALEKLECFSNMKLAFHAPVLDLNPVSVNNDLCELTLKETLYTISLASKTNAEIVTIHAGKRSAYREPVWADYNSLHKYLRRSSRFSSLKGVELCLENSEQSINNLCKTAEELRKFAEFYDLSITFDIKHAMRNAEEFYSLLNRVRNVHVSNSDEKRRHVQASKNERVAKILRDLSEFGYDSLITVELDDLGIGNMDFGKKVDILREEGDFIRRIFKK